MFSPFVFFGEYLRALSVHTPPPASHQNHCVVRKGRRKKRARCDATCFVTRYHLTSTQCGKILFFILHNICFVNNNKDKMIQNKWVDYMHMKCEQGACSPSLVSQWWGCRSRVASWTLGKMPSSPTFCVSDQRKTERWDTALGSQSFFPFFFYAHCTPRIRPRTWYHMLSYSISIKFYARYASELCENGGCTEPLFSGNMCKGLKSSKIFGSCKKIILFLFSHGMGFSLIFWCHVDLKW